MPDMRLPISYCLGSPSRLALQWGHLDFSHTFSLDFEPPDREAFAALDLAYHAARRAGAAPAWLSAANEVCVEAFLQDRIRWADIVPLVAATMDEYEDDPLSNLDAVVAADALARRITHDNLPR
jgi:1-deoxy-D-xylulose-5-phosphate reductoisomerase